MINRERSAAHVRGGVSRAGGGKVDAMSLSLLAAGCLPGPRVETLLERELRAYSPGPVLEHSPEAHEVIAAELVACTLGQRRRYELQVGPGAGLRAMLMTLQRFRVPPVPSQLTGSIMAAIRDVQRDGKRAAVMGLPLR